MTLATTIMATSLLGATSGPVAISEQKNSVTDKNKVSSKFPTTKFADGAKLSQEQCKNVIALARKCGMKRVTEISTFMLHPSPLRGITVKGVEQIKGRKVSTQFLRVQFEDWCPSEQKPKKDDVEIDKFWASKPFTRESTILKVGEKEYRISSIHGLTPDECDHLLGQLLDGNYTTGDSVRREILQQIDWTKPQFFQSSNDSISVGFLHRGGDSSGFFDLQIETTPQKTIIIQQVLQAVP